MNEPAENISFEDLKQENGIQFWWASDLARLLDYKDLKSFEKVLNRSMKTCLSLNIPVHENFISHKRILNDSELPDFKLTRFAPSPGKLTADGIYFRNFRKP